MKRLLIISASIAIGGVAAWQAASALQSTETATAAPTAPKPAAPKSSAPAAPQQKARPALGNSKDTTPMAERVATIGLLNKRNGLARDLTMKPGEKIRIGDVIMALRACETTAPWEAETLTGAFVQVITREADAKWKRVFSGWLYKESPSLNVVEHPVYDVWVKSCQMRHPDIGPDTLIAREGDVSADDSGEE
jgi:hypothetical protein